MDIALRPTLLGTLSNLVARATARGTARPAVIRDFDPDRQVLTLTVEGAKAGDEILFRDTDDGCRIELGGRIIAVLQGTLAADLDEHSLELRAA